MQANKAVPAADIAQETSREHRAPLIQDLGGVWQRSLLIEPDGTVDRDSDVYWLQLGTLCGDIRSAPDQSCQSAFAGILSARDEIFHWAPRWAYGLTEGAPPDEGYLRFEGAILREDGVHAAYVEHWRRVAVPSGDDFACWLTGGSENPRGLLLRIGRFAFCAHQLAGAAKDTEFRLFTRSEQGWAVAASTPGHAPTGVTFTWPEVLRICGIESTDTGQSAGSATSRARRLNIEECI